MPKNPSESIQQHLRQRLNRHARERWPHVDAVTVRFRGGFAYVAAELPGEESLPLCRLRFIGVLHTWGFALYLASTESYRDDILPSGLPTALRRKLSTAQATSTSTLSRRSSGCRQGSSSSSAHQPRARPASSGH
ncbi:hypothetical protein [Streptomyces albidoflavus]|uniref:hypothetical protein n=1 Tax=Streptomyces albidoflavus TaxID=1886 RepID=UPI001C42EBCF|nr:hypothetical protein [Streptomyces albidoflavus]